LEKAPEAVEIPLPASVRLPAILRTHPVYIHRPSEHKAKDILQRIRDTRGRGGDTQVMNYQDIITVEPDKRGGQPCIRGLRITVYDVLSYLASGMTEDEIISDYPDLTHEDILASLSYAADRERKTAISHA
jgi:uncharacterized protein (DUF433 family)